MILFCIPHLGVKKGQNQYLYFSSALAQFPFSVWCCCSKPPAQLCLHPVPHFLLPLMGQALLSPLIIPTLPIPAPSHIYLFFAMQLQWLTLFFFFCIIFTPSLASVVLPNNFILRIFVAAFCPSAGNPRPWLMRSAGFVLPDQVRGPWAQASVG